MRRKNRGRRVVRRRSMLPNPDVDRSRGAATPFAVTAGVHPLDTLHREHELIAAVLDAIDEEARRMQRAYEVRLGFWLQALDFLEHFADEDHHGKEAEVLWPMLERAGVGRQHGPLAQLAADYEQGRTARGRMVEALASQDVPGLATAATSCTRQMRRQIEKEETLLLPLAGELLDTAALGALRDGFAQSAAVIGDDQHARMRRLATTLRAG